MISEDPLLKPKLGLIQVMHMDEEMFSEGYESSPMLLGTELDVEDNEYISAVERSLLGTNLVSERITASCCHA